MISSYQPGNNPISNQGTVPTSGLAPWNPVSNSNSTQPGTQGGDQLSSTGSGSDQQLTQQLESTILQLVSSVIQELAQQAEQMAQSTQSSAAQPQQTSSTDDGDDGVDDDDGYDDGSTSSTAPSAGQGTSSDPQGNNTTGGQQAMLSLLGRIMQEVQQLESELSGDASSGSSGNSISGSGNNVSGTGNNVSGSGNQVVGNNNAVSDGSSQPTGMTQTPNTTPQTQLSGQQSGSSSAGATGSITPTQGSSNLAQNEKTVVTALKAAGANPQQISTILAMGEQETNDFSSDQRDTSKDGTPAQNYSAFNLNGAALQLMGVKPSDSLNDQSNVGSVAVDILHGFQNAGETKVLDAVRGGSAALADGTSYGAQQYVSDIQASAASIEQNNNWDNGTRTAANLYHV